MLLVIANLTVTVLLRAVLLFGLRFGILPGLLLLRFASVLLVLLHPLLIFLGAMVILGLRFALIVLRRATGLLGTFLFCLRVRLRFRFLSLLWVLGWARFLRMLRFRFFLTGMLFGLLSNSAGRTKR
jgi:hypothetical protein